MSRKRQSLQNSTQQLPERRAHRRSYGRYLWCLSVAVIGILFLRYGHHLLIAYRLYTGNKQVHSRLPALPAPHAGERIVIFAPHEDDETLGCGGLIQQAVHAGADVSVVMMTNGDYRGLTSRILSKTARPAEYIKLGYVRQRETLAALRLLGVDGSSVTFLGYPNGPLYRMWLPEHWLPGNPARSSTTRCTQSPYNNAFTPQAVYCGQSVVSDVEAILQRLQPDMVLIPHPNDINADHWSSGCYVQFALSELRARNIPFSRSLRVFTYLVHRQQWPASMRYLPTARLVPPAGLIHHVDYRWQSLPLTRQQTYRKFQALRVYRTQAGTATPLIRALTCGNELFTRVLEQYWPAAGDLPLQSVISDPTGESEPALTHPDADIAQLLAGREGDHLRMLLYMRGTITPATNCRVIIHAGGATPESRLILDYTVTGRQGAWSTVRGNALSQGNAGAMMVVRHGKVIQLDVPWPFTEYGAHRQQFFMIQAMAGSHHTPVNITMTKTVWLLAPLGEFSPRTQPTITRRRSRHPLLD